MTSNNRINPKFNALFIKKEFLWESKVFKSTEIEFTFEKLETTMLFTCVLSSGYRTSNFSNTEKRSSELQGLLNLTILRNEKVQS